MQQIHEGKPLYVGVDTVAYFNINILGLFLFGEKIINKNSLSFFVEFCDEKMVNFVK